MASVVLDVTSERVRPQRSVRRIVTPRRNSSRLLAAVITFLTLVATLAGISFPGTVSQSVFVPLIVCAGFLLSGRTLARAIAVVVAGYLVVVASPGVIAPSSGRWRASSSPSSASCSS